jgi:hypothetical protein
MNTKFLKSWQFCAILILVAIVSALAQAQQSLPSWPQPFSVRGPETSSFGFAVTQPGPIAVEVQWQGPPLRVALQGPNGVEQTGAGRVVLNYVVTPQDLQRGVLWSVNVSLQTAAPTAANGQIVVRHPPVDAASAQRAAQSLQSSLTKQQIDAANAQADAHVERVMAARKAQFTEGVARREQAERAQFRQRLSVPNTARPAPTAPTVDGVSSRAVPPGGSGTLNPGFRMPPGAKTFPPAPAPPPFQITALSETSGGPKKGLVISGTGFRSDPGGGVVRGRVYLTIPPGIVAPCPSCTLVAGEVPRDQAQAATIVSWSDTAIVAELPDVIGVMQYQAEIFVSRDGELSNLVPFSFVPRQEMRVIRVTPGDRRHSGTVLTAPPTFNGGMVQRLRLPVPFGEFAGEKGNDEYFLRTQLRNGWTMSGVQFFPPGQLFNAQTGGAELNATYSLLGNAYVESQGGGPNPYVNVRWWINPFRPFMVYRYAIEIVGPAGVPDGIVVP